MTNKPSWNKEPQLEYKKYRVRGHIKSFRDLEIYKQTTKLSSNIFRLELPQNLKGRARVQQELEITYNLAKNIPRLIAEAYGDRFSNRELAYSKLEEAMRGIRHVITKLDFLIDVTGHRELQRIFARLIKKYQVQRRKVLNLKKAWERVEEKRVRND